MRVNEIEIEIRRLSADEISSWIEAVGDKYYVEVTNGIKLPYTKTEAYEFVNNRYREVNISVSFEIMYGADKVGKIGHFCNAKNIAE